MRRQLLACFLALLAGCATTQQNRTPVRVTAASTTPASAAVFVANGAGDSRAASQNLTAVAAEASTPLQVETFVWSRGSKRVVVDQVDRDNHLAQGRRLAEEVTAYRQNYPHRKIYLLGQSAGGAVVLSAAELLPSGTIDRIILLSPSVCACHDLRPALQASRDGIDLFYSKKDIWVLGLAMGIVGTTDEGCSTAAGRVGFQFDIRDATDAALYMKLRQHPWDPSVQWTGNNGGHFGNLEPRFLRAYVLPLLVGENPANAGCYRAPAAPPTKW